MGKVLIACEESQTVCKAFRELGHEAYSCDIQECSGGKPEWHIQDDVLNYLDAGWDLMIAHPPCTYISNMSNCRIRETGRMALRLKGFDFFMKFVKAPIVLKAIENPRGLPEREYRKADQIIQPFEYGHPMRKTTCLWLFNLPLLKPTNIIEPQRKWDGKRWRNWTDTLKGAHNSKNRSKTFPGIAKAMAEQWGSHAVTTRRHVPRQHMTTRRQHVTNRNSTIHHVTLSGPERNVTVRYVT